MTDFFDEIKRQSEELLDSDDMKPFLSGVQDTVDTDDPDEELEAGKEMVGMFMDNPELDPADGIEALIDDE